MEEYDPTHTTLKNLMEGIPEGQFENIFLIHHNPEWTKEDWEQVNDMVKGTKFSVLNDGEMLEI